MAEGSGTPLPDDGTGAPAGDADEGSTGSTTSAGNTGVPAGAGSAGGPGGSGRAGGAGGGAPEPGGGTGGAGGDGDGAAVGRAGAWIRRHGPSTLVGSVLVAVVGAAVTVGLTALLGDGSGGGDAGGAPGSPTASVQTTAAADPKSPPSCSGEGCTGLDPKTTGCGDSGKTVASQFAGTMHLEIRYSQGCRTVWGKLTGAEVGDTVEIQTSPTLRQTAKVRTGHTQYTLMLPAPKEFTAQATAVAVNGTVVREVPKGHILSAGADSTDLPAGEAAKKPETEEAAKKPEAGAGTGRAS